MSEQHVATIKSMKSSVGILRAIARNCSDLEAADEIVREANMIAGKLAAPEGTPEAKHAALAANSRLKEGKRDDEPFTAGAAPAAARRTRAP